MKKQRTDSLEYIAKKHKQEQEEYLKAGVVKRVALYARQSVDKKDSISIDTQLDACRRLLKENIRYWSLSVHGIHPSHPSVTAAPDRLIDQSY